MGLRVRGPARWRAVAVGAAAALGAPLLIRRQTFAALLVPNAPRPCAPAGDEVACALRAADFALNYLHAATSWLPAHRRPWRDSCLYRSLAECMVLRRYGRIAHVALGAGRIAGDAVGAHAWVIYDGPEPVERAAPEFVEFRPSAVSPR